MIRRFLTRVLIVILIGGCAYNWWLLREARAQIAVLQAELMASKRHAAHTSAETIPNGWIDRAQRHAALARAAARRGDIPTAQRELSLSAAAAQNAVTEPALRTEERIQHMEALLKSAQAEASTLVRQAHQGLDGAPGAHHAP